MKTLTRLASSTLLVTCMAVTSAAPSATSADLGFRALYRELVEINTTRSTGSCTHAAEAMRAHLTAAGYPEGDLKIVTPPDRPQDGALLATLPGRDRTRKPILLLAHLDVVEVRREDWAREPFKLTEENGVFYARGSSDDKAMAAIFLDSLIRFKQDGYKPRRGLKLALTCGEETPDVFNGVKWLLQTHPDELAAAFALNEGAFGELDKSENPVALQIQAGEKIYQDFSLETSDSGGHSARPYRSNAIVRLSTGISRLGVHQFPLALNQVTRAYFQSQIPLVSPNVAVDIQAVLKDGDEAAAGRLWDRNPNWNGMMRTTCVVTQIEGGHAPNALPEHSKANVNCRILPGTKIAEVQHEIESAVNDGKIVVKPTGIPGVESSIPPLTNAILEPARRVAQTIWPGIPIIPTMLPAATDGRFLNAAGIPTYGVSGIFQGVEGSNAHGFNEHIRVKSLLDARRFLYAVLKLYSDG